MTRGRGASGRRNKDLRAVGHHAGPAGGAVMAEGVVLPDEGTRDCGRWGTTPVPPEELLWLRVWCFRTKEQGFAGGEAPRRPHLRRIPAGGAYKRGGAYAVGSLFYIEKNLRNEFPFVAGGEVVVDAEFVGIRKDLQLVLPAEVQQLPVGAFHGLVGAVVVNAGHLACRQDFDVLRFLCFLDGQECNRGFRVSSVQNIFVRDNDAGLEENRELILQRLGKTLLRGDADFPEGLWSLHRGEEDTALGDVLYGHLLIALAKFFYVLHLFTAMRQPMLDQLQAFDLPVDDGKLLPQDDQRGVDGVVFHVLLNFAQGKT